MRDYFHRFALYNRWANARLYEAVGRLTPEAFVAPRSGFFPSIMRTLNHILVADKVWLSRLTGQPHGLTALDQVIHESFSALNAERAIEDKRIIACVEGIGDEAFGQMLRYRTMTDGKETETEIGATLTHLFNHQTHHRGQVHAMLSSTDVSPPPRDFIYFQRETA